VINIDTIKSFYPPGVRDNPLLTKYIIKEYIQLMILDYLSSSEFIRKLIFIGGTNLRLTRGLDRFSEDLDFDCKDFSADEFFEMTGDIIRYLRNSGLNVEARDRENPNLTAFRRNLYFPGFLYELGLSGHRDERFLIKLECEDQKYAYSPLIVNIKGCGFFFPLPVPPDGIICAMKVSAMLDRRKGRDFYDAMFLLSQATPDFGFLSFKCNIGDMSSLKEKALEIIEKTDLKRKAKDFEFLLFNKEKSKQILHAEAFFRELND